MNKEDIIKKVEKSLDGIRPFLQKDGGDVKVIDILKDSTLLVEFLGNCSTCSMSAMTFKNGIEENIKNDVPEVLKVEVVNLMQETV
tara:strand:- start:281 stop:538 length:258 start_codon:yes stop_codon:yes gene_type:complete